MSSSSYMTCELKVDTKSEGWHKTMRKVLKKVKGATYSIDAEKGMAYISGKVNPTNVLKKIVKAGKNAELSWIGTGDQYKAHSYGRVVVDHHHQRPYHLDYPNYGSLDPYFGHGYQSYNHPYINQPPMAPYYPNYNMPHSYPYHSYY